MTALAIEKLNSVAHAAMEPRGVGSTYCAVNAVKNTPSAILVTHDSQFGDRISKEHNIETRSIQSPQRLMGHNGPIVFDHYAVWFICAGAIKAIEEWREKSEENARSADKERAEKVTAQQAASSYIQRIEELEKEVALLKTDQHRVWEDGLMASDECQQIGLDAALEAYGPNPFEGGEDVGEQASQG